MSMLILGRFLDGIPKNKRDATFQGLHLSRGNISSQSAVNIRMLTIPLKASWPVHPFKEHLQ